MDLRIKPKYRVLVEREEFAFFVDLDYDNLPEFCKYCNCIGHNQRNCKRAMADNTQAEKDKQKVPKKTFQQGRRNMLWPKITERQLRKE